LNVMERKEFTPRILSTNIKTRKLGYIIGILRILDKNFLDVDSLVEKLESWSQSNSAFFQSMGESGWLKRTTKHYPALRYIQLAEDLELVKIVGRECGVTKLGQPILFLAPIWNNPFELSSEQICYLFKRILVVDYDFLMPLLKLLSSPKIRPKVFDDFKKAVLGHLQVRETSFGDIIKSSKFRNRIQLIEKWSKEREYLQHIIYPRLDWLVDLKMVNLDKNQYELAAGCKAFLESLNSVSSEEELEQWFDNDYYEAFSDIFRRPSFETMSQFDALSKAQQSEQLHLLLEESFMKFSSANLPFQHLSARTFLEYTCVKLMSKMIVATFKQVIEVLKTMTDYKFQWEYLLDDGYVTRA
jgi:hypothetical protein